MTQTSNPISSSITEIRTNLDSTFSYIVLEKEIEPDESSRFSEIIQVLSGMGKNILDRQLYRDELRKKDLLVLKMGPEENETIMHEIIGRGLPGSITCYFYKRSPRSPGDSIT